MSHLLKLKLVKRLKFQKLNVLKWLNYCMSGLPSFICWTSYLYSAGCNLPRVCCAACCSALFLASLQRAINPSGAYGGSVVRRFLVIPYGSIVLVCCYFRAMWYFCVIRVYSMLLFVVGGCSACTFSVEGTVN
jgi:hypothetical protein